MASGERPGDAGELGAVVLRRERAHRLRPLLFALLFLLLLDGLLRLLLPPDERVLRDPLNPYGCYREDDLARLVQARAHPQGALDVVLLGDSVLSAVNNRDGERVEDYLRPQLEARVKRPVRVWNLGRGGSHAADLYGALRQLLDQVPPRPDLIVVLNSNHIFFSRRHAAPAMLYPCLAGFFADDQAALLRVPAGPGPTERRLTGAVTRAWYLYQQRRRINEALFGGPPRDRLREQLIDLLNRLRAGGQGRVIDDPNLPWSERGLSAAQYAPNYDFIPLSSPEAINHQMTRRLADFLRAQERLRVFVFLTPQNHGLLGALADNPRYREVASAVQGLFAGVPFRSYDGLVADRLFQDLDHLTAAGNRRLAELLAEDLLALPAR